MAAAADGVRLGQKTTMATTAATTLTMMAERMREKERTDGNSTASVLAFRPCAPVADVNDPHANTVISGRQPCPFWHTKPPAKPSWPDPGRSRPEAYGYDVRFIRTPNSD